MNFWQRTLLCSLSLGMMVLGSSVSGFANSSSDNIIPTKTASGRDFPVEYRQALPLNADRVRYPGFKQESVVLKKVLFAVKEQCHYFVIFV